MVFLFSFLMQLSDPQEQQEKIFSALFVCFILFVFFKDVNKKSGKMYFNVLISN